MIKPLVKIRIETTDGFRSELDAVIDPAVFYSKICLNALPKSADWIRCSGTQRRNILSGRIHDAVGWIPLVICLEGHELDVGMIVCSSLPSPVVIGKDAIHPWGITIERKNGRIVVRVARDRNDPDVRTVLCDAA